MGFAKLDTRILDSTLWLGGMEMKLTFITALLMARPHEALEPLEEIDDEGPTGYAVPAGWYGLVEASGPGIVARAGLDPQRGLEALDRLAETEKRSFSPDFGGRRMIRTRHGYLILNFMRYRDHDHGSADRVRRYRERQRGNGGNGGNGTVTRNVTPVTPPVTQSESEVKSQRAEVKKKDKAPTRPAALADVEAFWAAEKLHGGARAAANFWDYYESNGWKVGGKAPMKNWQAAARGWARREFERSPGPGGRPAPDAPIAGSKYPSTVDSGSDF